MAACGKCGSDVGKGGIVQEDGSVLCMRCDGGALDVLAPPQSATKKTLPDPSTLNFCPSCSAVWQRGSKLCTRCGYDALTGQNLTPGAVLAESATSWRAAKGPVLAVAGIALVVAAGVYVYSAHQQSVYQAEKSRIEQDRLRNEQVAQAAHELRRQEAERREQLRAAASALVQGAVHRQTLRVRSSSVAAKSSGLGNAVVEGYRKRVFKVTSKHVEIYSELRRAATAACQRVKMWMEYRARELAVTQARIRLERRCGPSVKNVNEAECEKLTVAAKEAVRQLNDARTSLAAFGVTVTTPPPPVTVVDGLSVDAFDVFLKNGTILRGMEKGAEMEVDGVKVIQFKDANGKSRAVRADEISKLAPAAAQE